MGVGLPRAPRQGRPRVRGQGPARAPARRRQGRAAVRARGRARRPAAPPERDRRGRRRRDVRRHALHGDGLRRGRRPRDAARRGADAAASAIIHLVRQLLEGLYHAHEQGLIHRDFKPENVIVERDTPRRRGAAHRRLRDRDPARGRRRPPSAGPADHERPRARHAALHGARAGGRRSDRSPHRSVRARHRDLRDAVAGSCRSTAPAPRSRART